MTCIHHENCFKRPASDKFIFQHRSSAPYRTHYFSDINISQSGVETHLRWDAFLAHSVEIYSVRTSCHASEHDL